jgi:hypothetical protein
MKNLCFIFGSPRSGTTWTWGLLESHPRTIPFIKEHIGGSLTEIREPYNTSESGIYIKKPGVARGIISNFCKKYSDRLVIEKTPSHILHYYKILKDFPNAKIILIDRNPLGICNSMLNSKMKAFGYTLEKSISSTKKFLANHDDLINMASDRILLLNYEDMLLNTVTNIEKIYTFLGLDLKYIEKAILENNKSTKVKVPGLIRKAEAQSYKSDLNEALEYVEYNLINEIRKYESRLKKN